MFCPPPYLELIIRTYLAAHLAETGKLPVLFIPLHLFDPSSDLVEAINNYLRDDIDDVLPPNPLEKVNAEQQVLLIFDGLDELAMQGEMAAKVSQGFIREILGKLLRFNQSEARVFTLVSGRDLAVEAIKTEFRKEGQILYLLPYFQTEEEKGKHTYSGEQDLLQQDQRQVWWKNYGQLKAKLYPGLPAELDQGKLVEITVQPLLNYLVALSYDRGEVNFSTESNLNVIYNDLLEQVYKRDWEGYRHPTLGNIKPSDFIRILEEIAIACWHGNGRTTTIKCILDRCVSGTLKHVLEIFKGGVNKGVTRLLTAFYFHQSGIQGSEATFEFTHKSFGEYLTAHRLVLELQFMQRKLTQHRENPNFGWNEKECLKRWTVLCGPTAIDEYLLSFLHDEVQLQSKEQVQQWQTMLCDLIGYMLRHGMPLEELTPRPVFLSETKQARNASEALLAALSSCAWVTKDLSKIDWPSPEAFGSWLAHLQGQRTITEDPVALICLNHLNLETCILINRDFEGACFEGARLVGASLGRASLVEASLEGVNLEGVSLEGARLDRANLEGTCLIEASLLVARLVEANLKGARLDRAHLDRARLDWARFEGACLDQVSLDQASLEGASLEGASLKGANLEGARLERANLERANLVGASLYEARLEGANLKGSCLEGTSLDQARLEGASLEGASLEGASLEGANLEGANLEGVNLEGANLKGTNLKDIAWNKKTNWKNVTGWETAQKIQKQLKQQIELQ